MGIKETIKIELDAHLHFYIMVIVALAILSLAVQPADALLTDGLVHYYSLDNVSDRLGVYDLTNYNSVAFGTGKVGNGAIFDGAAKFLNTSNPVINTSNNTISFWVKSAGSQMIYATEIHAVNTSGRGYVFHQDDPVADKMNYLWGTKGAGYNVQSTYNPDSDTNWHFIVVMSNSTNSKYYEDGVNIANFTSDGGCTNCKFYVGGESGQTRYWNGTIDEIGIWNRTITDAEIASLYNSGNGLAYDNFLPPVYFTINITYPANTTYHVHEINLSYIVNGSASSYSCNHTFNGSVYSGYNVSNGTQYNSSLYPIQNGTASFIINCSDGSHAETSSVNFTNDIGKILLTTWNEATDNYTIANQTTILVYNSSSSMNFTGNNFTWGYTELPGGNITLIAFFNNISRELSLINNATNYANNTLSFPALTSNYYFLIHNIYNNPIENALVTFSRLDGTLITQRYSQSDGYVYDIFLTLNVPVNVVLQKSGYVMKTLTFTPYLNTQLPVTITMDLASGNGTEYNPFANLSITYSPTALIQNNGTLITCILQESQAAMLGSRMDVYYVNYSGSYLAKTTTCSDHSSCTFTFTLNKTASRFRFNLTMNLTYANYTAARDYVTNGTGDTDLPAASGMDQITWKFIFFVICLCILAITWGYFGALSLLVIPVVIGIGVLYHIFGIGEFILILIVIFIIFMKMV